MPMTKKKPDYDPAKIMEEFFSAISDSYNHPAADEAVDGHKKMELVAEEFSISRLKARKIPGYCDLRTGRDCVHQWFY